MTRKIWFIAAAASSAALSMATAQTAAPASETPSATTSPVDILVAKREKEPVRKADLDMLLPLLEENARAYAENRLEPHRLDLWLAKWAKYDVDTTEPLVEILNTAIRKYPKNNVVLMRIMNDLITPLGHSGSWAPSPETAKKVLDVILPVRAQQKYMDMPKVDAKTLDKLKMPSAADAKNIKPEMLLQKTAEVQKVRDLKMKGEWPAITNNEQLWELDGRIYYLRLKLASEEEDKKLVQEIVDAATRRNLLFSSYLFHIVSVVTDGSMKEARIKFFFLPLKNLCEGAAKKDALNQELIRKLADAGIRGEQWRLIEALSTPTGKLTDDQKKNLATAKLDETALRKAFSECPFEKSTTPMSSYIIIFRPDEESEFKINSLHIPGVHRSVKGIGAKCGESLADLPK